MYKVQVEINNSDYGYSDRIVSKITDALKGEFLFSRRWLVKPVPLEYKHGKHPPWAPFYQKRIRTVHSLKLKVADIEHVIGYQSTRNCCAFIRDTQHWRFGGSRMASRAPGPPHRTVCNKTLIKHLKNDIRRVKVEIVDCQRMVA